MRLVDGVVLVVDVVEGVQVQTEMVIKHAVLSGLPLVLLINKMDRLILELKLPPTDAYFKLKHVVEEVNTHIENAIPGRGEQFRVSPEKGNVCFSCSSMDWCFTLPSFAKMYAESYPNAKFDSTEFSRRLWGDIFFNPRSRKFTRKAVEETAKRSFVHFVLEPIYKLYSHTISESPGDLKKTLVELGISLKPSQLKSNAKDLLRLVCEQFFGPASGFVDMVVQHVPSSVEGAKQKLEHYYTGPTDTKTAKAMLECDPDGPLVVHITKLINTPDAKGFNSFGRVMSGTARPGQKVRVLGENYSIDDEEDMANATIDQVWIAESRYNVPTSGIPAGNFVLLGGVDNSIVKTATAVAPELPDGEDAYIFKPVAHFFESVFKVAVEPINPSELPKMLDGLRKINKSYPLITTKVEEMRRARCLRHWRTIHGLRPARPPTDSTHKWRSKYRTQSPDSAKPSLISPPSNATLSHRTRRTSSLSSLNRWMMASQKILSPAKSASKTRCGKLASSSRRTTATIC